MNESLYTLIGILALGGIAIWQNAVARRIEAENARLRAELAQLKREQAAWRITEIRPD